jgi:arylsulfatase A-like enzyme/tetratricopeptide (TPR) repeat protein
LSRANSTRWRAAAALILLAGAMGAWWWTTRHTVRRRPDLNVLLITVDTLRADAVGAYGQPGGVTPWIDRLAEAGVRFDDAHAHNVITLPSHANLLSGRLPLQHGVRDNGGFRFPSDLDTLATRLKAHGYRTGAFVSAFPLESRFGLARGFDVYDDRFADTPRPAFLIQERRGTDTVALARRWLDSTSEGRWFCWVHLYEPHFPYEPAEPFASRFPNDPYHGEVAAADAALGPLVEPILHAGRNGRTLVVLTSDHGESLGDHGEATHGVFAYEAALRVPLIFYQPQLFPPAVVRTPAGHVDLLPTILDALSLPAPDDLVGQSLLPVVEGREPTERTTLKGRATYFEALSASLNRRWAPLVGVIDDRTKYIELPIPELYDLRADPGEAHNLAHAEPRRLEGMRALLSGVRASAGRSLQEPGVDRRAEDAETRERLRSLGYVAAGASEPPRRYTEEDDPKRLIGLDTLLQDVVGLYLAGDVPAALARCRELVRRRPQMPLSLVQLAHLERESGNLPAAVDALRKAVALGPDNTEAVSLLGAYLTEAGRAREAVDRLEPYTDRPDADVDVLVSRALALAKLGRPADALATLATARARDPSNAMTLVEIGTVHMMAGDRERASQAFEAAIAINPNVARAHISLGVLAAEGGRPDQAIEHWRAATALDPREHDKLLALGVSLARSRRPAEAQLYFEFFVATAPPARYARDIERAREWLKRTR